jgi:hypothetical protein
MDAKQYSKTKYIADKMFCFAFEYHLQYELPKSFVSAYDFSVGFWIFVGFLFLFFILSDHPPGAPEFIPGFYR